MRVALVTDELPGVTPSGGIGSAFEELARLLARSGYRVTLLVVLHDENVPDSWNLARRDYARAGILLRSVPVSRYAYDQGPSSRSYAVFQSLEEMAEDLDVVHVADFKGLGFHAMSAKRQGLAFATVKFVLQTHGPVRWTLEANSAPFTVNDQLKCDFMERKCIEWADEVVSPSAYLRDWFVARGWVDEASDIQVIKNVCSEMYGEASLMQKKDGDSNNLAQEIVFFGRHEERKGIATFCDALDRLNTQLTESGVSVTFLGGFGRVRDGHSGLHILDKAKRWTFPWKILPGLDRHDAMRYLAQAQDALVLVASQAENSPYAVFEALALNLPVLTSREGGASELIHPDDRVWSCADLATPQALVEALTATLAAPLARPRLAESLAEIETQWLRMHSRYEDLAIKNASKPKPRQTYEITQGREEYRKITVGITHFERPSKLMHAVTSILRQDYPNVEVIVVDDGTSSAPGIMGLAAMEPLLKRADVKLIRRKNGYLGAARNSVIEHAAGELILFLDDDDLALPSLLSTLELSQRNTEAPIVVALNLYLQETDREKYAAQPETFDSAASYVPLGGPVSLAPIENVMGAATALMDIEVLRSLGGYSEIYGVGFEDYEMYARLLQHDHEIIVCPVPLYLYEVGKPSMISGTSVLQNYRRVTDSIDPSLAGDELRDLAELCAGRQASAVADERKTALYGESSQPDIRLALWREWPAAQATLEGLKSLAEGDGDLFSASCLASSLAALSHLALGTREKSEKAFSLQARTLRNGRELDVSRDLDPDLAEAYFLCSAGQDYTDALLRFSRSDRDLTLADCAALRVFPWKAMQDRSEFVASEVVKRIETAPLSQATEPGARALLAAIAWLQGDRPWFLALVEGVMAVEEEAYLAGNPDISEAVRQKTIPSGVSHFISYGLREGRPGFSGSQALAESLRDLDDAPATLAALVRAWRPIGPSQLARSRAKRGGRV